MRHHHTRLARLEQVQRNMAQRTVTATSRTCPCCEGSRVLQRGEALTVLPRKVASREDWAVLVAQAPERCETWKHHHYHEEHDRDE
jgi:hypothetical protein